MRKLQINQKAAQKVIVKKAVLLCVAVLASSCNQAPSTSHPIQDPEGLVQAIRDAGASIEAASLTTPLVDLPEPQFYLLDGALVQIGASVLDFSELQGLASANAELRIWSGSGWYLAYDGREGGVILLLSGLLGDPVQATPIALDEPFPPAVPHAMRILADEVGVSPLDLTVLAFQPAIWPDSCLGIEIQGAGCVQGEVSGWILVLLLDGTEYELHSDEAGEIVRWNDPLQGVEE